MSPTCCASDRDQARFTTLFERTRPQTGRVERTNVKIDIVSTNKVSEHFVATGEMIKFEGFLKVYLGRNRFWMKRTGRHVAKTQWRGCPWKCLHIGYRISAVLHIDITEVSLCKTIGDQIGRPSTYVLQFQSLPKKLCWKDGSVEGYERKYYSLFCKRGAPEKILRKLLEAIREIGPYRYQDHCERFLVAHFDEM